MVKAKGLGHAARKAAQKQCATKYIITTYSKYIDTFVVSERRPSFGLPAPAVPRRRCC